MAARHSRTSSRRGQRPPHSVFGSRTDVGCVRERNEDSLVVSPPLYAVADGMGGHAAGDVASEIAVRTLADHAPVHVDADALERAVIAANYAVIDAAQEKGREGMGTTLTAAILEKEHLAIAQVGDSRAYLLHQGKIQQITRDHSLMADMIEAGQLTPEEARVHPNRSMITRALSNDPYMRPDIYEINVEAGDRLLLCSDGLSGMLEDSEIEEHLVRTRDPQRCANVLTNDAIAKGGTDNITVIVVDVIGNREKVEKDVVRKSRFFFVLILLMLIAVIGAGGYGLYNYVTGSAYLVADNGKVAVYRGIPDSVFGLEFSWYDHTTDVSVSSLQPGVASRLENGIRVDDLDAANALVGEYEQEAAAKTAQTSKSSTSSSSSQASSGTTSTSSTATPATSAGTRSTA